LKGGTCYVLPEIAQEKSEAQKQIATAWVSAMPRWPHREEEPRSRVGRCCGERCRKSKNRSIIDQALFLMRPHVYRCRECYKLESGYFP